LQVKVGFEAELGEKAGDEGQATPRKKNEKTIPHRTMPGSGHGCLDLVFFIFSGREQNQELGRFNS
jgi:hypothetical protein